MSFSSEVKEELAKKMSRARHCQIAELAAMMNLCGQIGKDSEGSYTIGFQTENKAVLQKAFTLLKKTYNIDTGAKTGEEQIRDLLYTIGDPDKPVSNLLLKNSCCQRAFLRGAFLSIGSISDPKKGYHMEFVCTDEEKAGQLKSVIQGFDIEAKIILRKKYFVVYLKEGESIVDMLNICEAPVALMKLENMRILKEISNSVNRKVNCETANITKTVNAASRQIEDIEYVRDHYGFGRIAPNLRQMAELRLEYPDAPLKELGELLDPPVGKSGVNHRLRRLSELADRLREERNFRSGGEL